MIRLYRDGDSGLRFAGKDAAAERLAARAVLTEQRTLAQRLFEANMAMLGDEKPPATQEFMHLVRDEREEGLWRARRARLRAT